MSCSRPEEGIAATETGVQAVQCFFRIGRIPIALIVLHSSSQWAGGQSTQPADAQPATQPASGPIALRPAEAALAGLLTSPRLTGDWLGERTALQNAGITFQPALLTGYMQNFGGGLNTHHATDFPGLAQYNIELDFEKMKLIPGGSFFLRLMNSWNNGIRPDVGSLSHPYFFWGCNGDESIVVDKWWWRQRFLDDRIELRIGKLVNILDLFDVNAYASNMYSQFSNMALCSNAAAPLAKGLGAFLKVWVTDWLYVSAAAIDSELVLTRTGFDTAFHGPDHFLGFWEFGLTPKWDSPNGKLPGNYKLGWWYDPHTKKIFHKLYEGNIPQRYRTHDLGWYLSCDQLLWKENQDLKDKQGLGMFFRFAVADGDVDRISHSWSVGGQYEGLLPTRTRDVLAFGMSQSRSSGQYGRTIDHDAGSETVYEWYYSAEVCPWLSITPDIQVITDPGAVKTARDSIIGGVRLKVTF